MEPKSMAANDSDGDKARTSVEGLCKTVITTSGITLALLWALTGQDIDSSTLSVIKIASIVLVISMASALLALQFITSALEAKAQGTDRTTDLVTKKGTVAFAFFVAWFGFILGCALVIVAIFQVR
jgi:hypothetical protein